MATLALGIVVLALVFTALSWDVYTSHKDRQRLQRIRATTRIRGSSGE